MSILLLDCNLKNKEESQTNIEMMKEEGFTQIQEMEEALVKKMCDDIIAFKPDLVITEKGVSDQAQHFLQKANITAIRRLRKIDNLRVASTEEISESDIGTGKKERKKDWR